MLGLSKESGQSLRSIDQGDVRLPQDETQTLRKEYFWPLLLVSALVAEGDRMAQWARLEVNKSTAYFLYFRTIS